MIFLSEPNPNKKWIQEHKEWVVDSQQMEIGLIFSTKFKLKHFLSETSHRIDEWLQLIDRVKKN